MSGNPWRVWLLSVVVGVSGGALPCVRGQDVVPSALQPMLDHLESTDREERLEAVVQLSALGPYAHPAKSLLIRLLEADDQVLQYQTLIALGHLGPLAQDASGPVAAFLKSDSAFLQTAALESLRRIGSAAPEDVSVVRGLSDSRDAGVAIAATRCLVRLAGEADAQVQQSIPRLVKALEESRAEVRNEASLTLVEIGDVVVPAVTAALRSTQATARVEACEILGHLGPAAGSAVQDLLVGLNDADEQVVRAAITAIGDVHARGEVCVPALIRMLTSRSVPVRVVTARALGEFGREATSAVTALLPLIRDSHAPVRAAVAGTLGATGDGRVEVVSALTGLLADENAAVTVQAANGLSQLGEAAVPALVRLLQDERFRPLAIEILGEMGPAARAAVPSLQTLLTEVEVNAAVRHEALVALGHLGPVAKSAVPQLRGLLANSMDVELQSGVAWVLARIGDRESIPALKRLAVETQNERTRLGVAWALVTLDPSNPEHQRVAMPHLVQGLASDRWLVRKECLAALARLGSGAESAAATVLDVAQQDPDAAVRAEAIRALAELGVGSEQALPVAVAAFSDPATEVRLAARYLLGRLGSGAQQMQTQLRESTRVGAEFERVLAAWALVQVAPTPEHNALALPLMLDAAGHPEAAIRVEVAKTLGKIGGTSTAAREALVRLAGDEDATVRQAARSALQN